jgi:hypothetical protein
MSPVIWFPLGFRRTFGHGRSSPALCFALQAQILLAQLKGDQEREEEVRERLQVAPEVAPQSAVPAQLRRGLACACWRTCVHARVCVRLCASACCPVLTASLHPSAACRPSGAWMAPTDYLTTFAPATVSGVLETASAYSIDRANLLVGACFPIILPPLPAPPRPAPPRPASPLLCQTPLRRR